LKLNFELELYFWGFWLNLIDEKSREADVVFLNDARVKRIEIHQENVGVVESLFRLQHQTTSVRSFFSAALFTATFTTFFIIILKSKGLIHSFNLLTCTNSSNWFPSIGLVRHNITSLIERVEQQKLISFRATTH